MLRLDGNNVIYNNSENLGVVEALKHNGDGFSISLPGSTIFIPEDDCTAAEAEVFAAYHAFYSETGGFPPISPIEALPVFEHPDPEKVAMAEAIIDFDTRLTILEGGM